MLFGFQIKEDILVADEHAPPTSTSDFCKTKSSFNLEERIDLITAVCHLFREAASLAGSNNTCHEPLKVAGVSVFSGLFSQPPPRKMMFTTGGFNRFMQHPQRQDTKHQLDISLNVKSLRWLPALSSKEVLLNLTSVVNTKNSSNILDKVRLALPSKCYISVSEGKLVAKDLGCRIITEKQ